MRTIRLTTAVTITALLAALLASTPANAADLNVSGTVALDGVARAGVEVGWFDPATEASGKTSSAADGSFTLPVAAGHPFVFYAGNTYVDRHWKRQSADAVGVFLGSNGQDYLYQSRSLFPAITAPIAGVVLDLDLPGSITGSTPNLNGVEVSRTNGQVIDCDCSPKGDTFLLPNLIPGLYKIRVVRDIPHGQIDDWQSRTIRVGAGQTVTVNPDFADAGGSIAGRLTSNGKPLKGVQVYAYRDETGGSDTTDAAGRYSIANLPDGRYTVGLGYGMGYGEKTKYVPEQRTVTVKNGKKVKLSRDLESGTVLKGKVTGIAADHYLRITVLDENEKVLTGRSVVTKKSSSTFHLNGVPAGTHRVVITDGEKYSIVYARFAGGSISIGTVALTTPTVTLKGTLSGSSAGEIFYTIGNRSETGDEVDFPIRSYAVVKKGRFSIPGVIPGLATFDARVQNHDLKTTSITVGSAPIVLKAGTTWSKITGSLTLAGKPIGHAYGYADNDDIVNGAGGFEQKGGKFSGRVSPSTVRLSVSYNQRGPYFVEDSPYWFDIPKSKATYTVKKGAALDVGTIALTIKGRG